MPHPLSVRSLWLPLFAGIAGLLLGGCHLNPPVSPDSISQYVCPNGLTARVSYNDDKSVMRLGLRGRVSTLTRDNKSGIYGNGRYAVTVEERSLRMQTAGSLLPQNCMLQFAAAADSQVTGSINYRQRMALSPAAVVKVQLQDVSLMDVAAKVIAGTTLEKPGQVPIAFALSYDSSKIEEKHRYAVQVRIEENGKLLFINTQSYPVLETPEQNSVEVWVEPVAAAP